MYIALITKQNLIHLIILLMLQKGNLILKVLLIHWHLIVIKL